MSATFPPLLNERTRLWLLSSAALLALGLLTRRPEVLMVGVLVASSVLIAWLWAGLALARIRYERSLLPDRVYAGDDVTLEIAITNSKPLLVPWLRVEERLSLGLSPAPVQSVRVDTELREQDKQWRMSRTTSLGWYERVRWRYVLGCPSRGYHRIGPVALRSGDPLGLYEREVVIAGECRVTVYPRPLPLPEVVLRRTFPFEGERSARALIADPANVAGARPYSEDDTFRTIHWRATARSSELLSKVVLPLVEPRLVVFLDLATSERAGINADPEPVERAIGAAVTVLLRAREERWGVGLYANGLLPEGHRQVVLSPARGDTAYSALMGVLARLPSFFATMPLSELMRRERRRLPYGAVAVVITSAPTRSLLARVEAYRRSGVSTELLDLSGTAREEARV